MTGQKIKFCWAAFLTSKSLDNCFFFLAERNLNVNVTDIFILSNDGRMSLGSVHANEPGVLEAPLPALSYYVIYSSQLFKNSKMQIMITF